MGKTVKGFCTNKGGSSIFLKKGGVQKMKQNLLSDRFTTYITKGVYKPYL